VITPFVYQHAETNALLASLAPLLLELAAKGDAAAIEIVGDSVADLLQTAGYVVAQLFPETSPRQWLRVGLSGRILTHGAVLAVLRQRSSLVFHTITESPIEGVRRLILREQRAAAL
jgi:N-acetylglucosamine kinase-like BadF-type ATPase